MTIVSTSGFRSRGMLVVGNNPMVPAISETLVEANDMDIETTLFVVETMEETAWLTQDWLPVWSYHACSTRADLRPLVNAFAAHCILVDRRLRDEAA